MSELVSNEGRVHLKVYGDCPLHHLCLITERGQLCQWYIGKDFHAPLSVLSNRFISLAHRTYSPCCHKSYKVPKVKSNHLNVQSGISSTMPFGADITNRASGQAALPIAPKKSAAPLACIANGNLRSRRVVSDQAEGRADEHMQDASAIMSITPASEMSNADISMLSANARGDTTVTMREPTSSRSSGSDDSEESNDDPDEGVLQVL